MSRQTLEDRLALSRLAASVPLSRNLQRRQLHDAQMCCLSSRLSTSRRIIQCKTIRQTPKGLCVHVFVMS